MRLSLATIALVCLSSCGDPVKQAQEELGRMASAGATALQVCHKRREIAALMLKQNHKDYEYESAVTAIHCRAAGDPNR
jgi:hypothetical protein